MNNHASLREKINEYQRALHYRRSVGLPLFRAQIIVSAPSQQASTCSSAGDSTNGRSEAHAPGARADLIVHLPGSPRDGVLHGSPLEPMPILPFAARLQSDSAAPTSRPNPYSKSVRDRRAVKKKRKYNNMPLWWFLDTYTSR